jgi:hypothetical protein
MRNVGIEPEKQIHALETTLTELSRLQGLTRSVGETFIAFLIASAQRETGTRLNELNGTAGEKTEVPAL